jgi:hypothetical protein
VPKEADDGHTNLEFDAERKKLAGRWIEASVGSILPTLDLQTMTFEWLDDEHNVLQSHQMVGKTLTEVETSIEQDLSKLGLDPEGFTAKLHFEIPEYSWLTETLIQPEQKDLDEWVKYRSLANAACEFMLKDLYLKSEYRIWPHHFDTGIYVESKKKIGLGFGLAMKDSLEDVPYFYFAGYPLNGKAIKYHKAPTLRAGKWFLSESWSGAFLGLDTLENMSSDEQLEQVSMFVQDASAFFLNRRY